eukprot:scaffold236292_cov19-Tisochrysis_lutea.AAC.1
MILHLLATQRKFRRLERWTHCATDMYPHSRCAMSVRLLSSSLDGCKVNVFLSDVKDGASQVPGHPICVCLIDCVSCAPSLRAGCGPDDQSDAFAIKPEENT